MNGIKTFAAIAILFFYGKVNAQFGNVSRKELIKIQKDTLNILIHENDDHDFYLNKAIFKHWTFSDYKIYNKQTLHDKCVNNPNQYILGSFKTALHLDDHYSEEIEFLGLVNKYHKHEHYKKHHDVLMYFIFPHDEKIDNQYFEGYYELNVQLLNHYLETILNPTNKISSLKSYLKHLKSKYPKAKDKKILICKKDLKITKSDIKAFKVFDYEVVDRDRINEAIMNHEDVLVYYLSWEFHHANHVLFSPKEGDLYYYHLGLSGENHIAKEQTLMFKTLAK